MSNEIILLDTEYTTWPGARESGWAAPNQHREIVQIAAIKFDLASGRETGKLDILVKPQINVTLSQLFIDLTSITQEQVDKQGHSFPEALRQFKAFCQDTPAENIICYNADEDVFRENCVLHGIAFPFKEPWKKLRPALPAMGVEVEKNSSGTLHEFTDKPLQGHVHYALHDVRSMAAFIMQQLRQGNSGFVASLPVKPDLLVRLDINKARLTRMSHIDRFGR